MRFQLFPRSSETKGRPILMCAFAGILDRKDTRVQSTNVQCIKVNGFLTNSKQIKKACAIN